MRCKCVVMFTLLTLLLGACARTQQTQSRKEFSFSAGKLQGSKFTVNSGVKVSQDPNTHKIALMMAGEGPITIDCVCAAGGGSCFPVSPDLAKEGGVDIECASIDPCNRCEMYIISDTFNFRAMVASVRKQS